MFEIPKEFEKQMTIKDPRPYHCTNCSKYLANEDPIYFIGKNVYCYNCGKNNPLIGLEDY
jgi:hypothetical protein